MEQVLPVGPTHLSAGAGLRRVEEKVVGSGRGSLQENRKKERTDKRGGEKRRREKERR